MNNISKYNSNTMFSYLKVLFFLEIFLSFLFYNSSLKLITAIPNLVIILYTIIFIFKLKKIYFNQETILIPFINYFFFYIFVLIVSLQYFSKDIIYHASLLVLLFFLFINFNLNHINLSKKFDYFIAFVIFTLLAINFYFSQIITDPTRAVNLYNINFQRQYSFILSPELTGVLYILLFFIANKLKVFIILRFFVYFLIMIGILVLNSKALYASTIILFVTYFIYKFILIFKLSPKYIFIASLIFLITILLFVDDLFIYLNYNKLELVKKFGLEPINNLTIRIAFYNHIIQNFSLFPMSDQIMVDFGDRYFLSENFENIILNRIKLYGGLYVLAIMSVIYQICRYIHQGLILTAAVMSFSFSISLASHSFPNLIMIYLCFYVLIYEYKYKKAK